LQTGNEVHPFMQDGQNQRGLIFPGQTEQKVVPDPTHAQSREQIIPVSEGRVAKSKLGGGRFELRNIAATSLLFPRCARCSERSPRGPQRRCG